MRTTLLLVLITASVISLTACMQSSNATAANIEGAKKETDAGKGKAFDLTPDNATVEWTGTKVGGKHDGGFKKLSGKLTLSEDGKSIAKVSVDVETASIWADDKDKGNEKLQNHLKSDDFFNAEKYPTAKFVTTEIKPGKDGEAEITGNFTIRDVTKSITFPAKVSVADGKVTVDSRFKIDRSQWNVNFGLVGDKLVDKDVELRLKVNAK